MKIIETDTNKIICGIFFATFEIIPVNLLDYLRDFRRSNDIMNINIKASIFLNINKYGTKYTLNNK